MEIVQFVPLCLWEKTTIVNMFLLNELCSKSILFIFVKSSNIYTFKEQIKNINSEAEIPIEAKLFTAQSNIRFSCK